MQVGKWGNSLAVRLPSAVVDALELKEGDDIEISVGTDRKFEVSRDRSREEAIAGIHALGLPTTNKVFLDTNILVYASAPQDQRSSVAVEVVARGGTISVQVLNEFAVVARRKFGWDWPDIQSAVAGYRRALPNPRSISVETHVIGVGIAAHHGFRIYDSLLLASAMEAGCTVFLSEDMQHGRVIDSRLTIRNPFLH